MPVGRCSIRMAVSTLLRCCPPGPERFCRFVAQSDNSCSMGCWAGWIGVLVIGSVLYGAHRAWAECE